MLSDFLCEYLCWSPVLAKVTFLLIPLNCYFNRFICAFGKSFLAINFDKFVLINTVICFYNGKRTHPIVHLLKKLFFGIQMSEIPLTAAEIIGL